MQDYEILHKRMSLAGFSRFITASDGKRYFLPNAEYCMHSSGNQQTILNFAQDSAGATGKRSTVLVSQVSSWISNGLIPVK
jgi:hypothetical protein